RPSDVCVAPDGSLVVADWYDPGVGGHGMGDLERGRLFLVAPPEHSYHVPEHDFTTLRGAIETLKSPNMATRYLAYQAVAAAPAEKRDPALRSAFLNTSTKPHFRARYFHALVSLDGPGIIETALRDRDPRIRMAAVRATRHAKQNLDLVKQLNLVAADPDPRVRAEAAINLRFAAYPDADQLWAKIAQTYPGNDRWYLEALGIGADLHWDNRFNAYLEATGNKPDPDVVWRSRSSKTPALLGGSPSELRAYHFLPDSEQKTTALQKVFKGSDDEASFTIATTYLQRNQADETRLKKLADTFADRPEIVKLVTRFDLDGYHDELLAIINADPNHPNASNATRHLLGQGDTIANALAEPTHSLLTALGRTGDKRAIPHLVATLNRSTDPARVHTTIGALATTRDGETTLLELARSGELPDTAKFTTGAILGRSRDAKIRDSIATALDLPAAPGTEKFPPIPELVRMRGNANNGAKAYEKATCATCHIVKGKGLNFGPDLSEIGNKLPPEAIVEAILYPSNAVAHGYAGVSLTTKSTGPLVGLIDSETDTALTLRLPGGLTRTIAPADISKREDLPTSVMPQGLAAILDTQEFADLLAYLTSLK
ncbi:MAG: c-type cytochrome, partial [Verrucomicrobiales bacterium]|nr:c-type cytochrome [Verrucomicrobiales bacterium]